MAGQSSAVGGQKLPTSTIASLAELMAKYFRVSDSTSRELKQHAMCTEHEDVGLLAAQEASGKVAMKPRCSFEDRAPARLTSFLPPDNFGAVIDGKIYRSSFPKEENFGFLESLKLKTVLTLVPEEYPEPNVKFMQEHGIRHIQIHIPANKEVVRIDRLVMAEALGAVLDPSNYPLLIHCNKGKHRTGCVVGCLRKLQGEKMNNILTEYHTYAGKKARYLDEIFMTKFDERALLFLAREHDHAPVDDPIATSPLSTALGQARLRV